MLDTLITSSILTYAFIFFARIGYVSINTVRIVFVLREMNKTIGTINECNPNAIYSIEDMRIEDMRLVSESALPALATVDRKRRRFLNRK
jgi:hypothetical protein